MASLSGFAANLARHIGQTVTIFTTSGGESGEGFTGVLISVNCRFVRLISQIGSAPGCALGNCCDERRENTGNVNRGCTEEDNISGTGNQINFLGGTGNVESRIANRENRDTERRIDCTGRTLGAVVDIPIDRIAAFVHNSVGSGW
ncbi:hypothetical protein [Candidatus Clostridium stratigraminis]|uniref:Uncharacterized protein n=1 Tax=Candidatus Clostridium stratigraminis TaxID=3381661 RepID=A0ABW8SYH5_9CLOT